ncbi:MAG TPA: hypothetical protein VL359_03115, partial [bacterium]|nr:hypothetical protein [bacterium]
WLAALIGKARKAGGGLEALVVFNQVRDDAWRNFLPHMRQAALPVHPRAIPEDAAFARLFAGEPLPPALQALVLELLPSN